MSSAHQRGFTLIELLVVTAIIAIIAAMAVPGLLRSRLAANEASAISTIRAVSSANVAYQAVCGGYAISFNVLLTNRYLPEPLTGSPAIKSGYSFLLALGAGGGPAGSNVGMCVGAQSAFFVTGTPISTSDGIRSFALREPGTLYQHMSGGAIPDPPVIGGLIGIVQ